jgi:hypothetical protein
MTPNSTVHQSNEGHTDSVVMARRLYEIGTRRNAVRASPSTRSWPWRVIVELEAAEVGPSDSSIRAGKSVSPQPLPLTLGSHRLRTSTRWAPGVFGLRMGDQVYGVRSPQFVRGLRRVRCGFRIHGLGANSVIDYVTKRFEQ